MDWTGMEWKTVCHLNECCQMTSEPDTIGNCVVIPMHSQAPPIKSFTDPRLTSMRKGKRKKRKKV